MKKKLKLLMVFLLTFTFMMANVWGKSDVNKGVETTKGDTKQGATGSGCGEGDNSNTCILDYGGGMRVSIMYLTKNGDYKVITSKTYLQYTYGKKNGRTPVGDNKRKIKMAVNYNKPGNFWGTRYEYIKNGKVSIPSSRWTEYKYKGNRGSGKLTKGSASVKPLNKDWKGKVYQEWGSSVNNKKGYVDSRYGYSGIKKLIEMLISDKNEPLSAKDRILTKYVTSSGTFKLPNGWKIQGLGVDSTYFNEIACETGQVYLMAEPMFTFRGNDGKTDYFGTATEIASLMTGKGKKISTGKKEYYHALTYAVTIDKNLGVGQFTNINWKFPMKVPTSSSCKNYKCLTNANGKKYGVGIGFDWIGWAGDCIKCHKPENTVSRKPICSDKNNRTVEITQKFVEDSTCDGITETEARKKQAMKYHESGVLVGKTVGKFPNYCGVYCKDKAIITYPAKLENKIFLKYASTKVANGTATWPDLDTHKLSVIVNRSCQIDAEGSASKDSCKSQMDNLAKNSGKPYINFTFDYSDGYYGKQMPVKVYNLKNPVKKGNMLIYSTDVALTGLGKSAKQSEIRQTYSVYNLNQNRYQIIGSNTALSKYQRDYNVAQLAFSEESLNRGDASLNPRNEMNINTVQIGYKDNILVSNDKKVKYAKTINKYTCKYETETAPQGGCSICISKSTGKPVNVCCLAPTDAQAYDTYCENGYLKEEYDKCTSNYDSSKAENDLKNGNLNCNTIRYACSCKNKNTGIEYNMFDDTQLNNKDEQACMSKYFMKNGNANSLDSWKKAYKYCINIFERKGGSCYSEPTPKCPPDAKKHGGEPIPKGETQESWCNEKCPPNAKIHAGESIPEGQTEESWCNPPVPLCPEDSEINGGKPIPDDKTIDEYCKLPKTEYCPPDAKKHAGEPIPDGETKDTWCCNPITCPTACMCKRGTDLQYTYVTSVAVRLLQEGKASDEKAACKLAQDTSCSLGSSGTSGDSGTQNVSDNYLYHTIDLSKPFVESSLTNGSSDIQNRIPGSNWAAANENKESLLTTKYITSKKDTYSSGKKPLYEIDLTSNVTKAIQNYNKNHDYNDFTLKCNKDTGLCQSSFLKNIAKANGSMAGLSAQNFANAVKANKEGK